MLMTREQPEYHHVSLFERTIPVCPLGALGHIAHGLRQIIRWDEAGEVIIIEKPDELTEKILPLVFRQTRFASFSRQLNVSRAPRWV